MNDTAVSTDEQIRAFAASVRAHLDDLPADELDEIIGGLSADLADQAADNDGILDLGDPAEYADELRSAAGLPPRTSTSARRPLGERVRGWRAGVAAAIRRNPAGAWLLDLFGALRPVWWVLRGYGIYVIVLHTALFQQGRLDHWMVPDSLAEWAALAALVVLSTQWGRGRWLPRNALRHIRTVVSVASLVALVVAIPAVVSPRIEYVTSEYYAPNGLMLDGVQINNIFAYDADGNPIERVQLFTGKGTPLNLYGTDGSGIRLVTDDGVWDFGVQDDGLRATVATHDYRGQPRWNIYPLDEAELSPETGDIDPATIDAPRRPFEKSPGIDAASTPQPSETPDPGATPAPDETPTP